MINFITAYRAHLPFIAIHTDDPINVRTVLQAIAGKPVQPLPTAKNAPIGDSYLWWTEDPLAVNADMYRKLCASTASAVVINPDKPSPLVYDTGILETPTRFYQEYLKEFVAEDQSGPIVLQLKGLSLKAAQEVVQLTMARVGSIAPQEIRKTRQMMGGQSPGLTTLETDYDFYEWPESLQQWVTLNDAYFLNLETPRQLVPRGLLLQGEPGVGKTMAASVLAKHWDVPLFHLDIPTSLNRYLGESESRIARNLNIIEQNAPCVWLLDEVEKLFGTAGGDEGTAQRILSQILWWLQSHQSRVLSVMTTNKFEILPKELYRPGRIDRVLRFDKLGMAAARSYASRVYQVVLKAEPTSKRMKAIREMLDGSEKPTFSHAEVRAFVYDLIKKQEWVKET